MNYVIDCEEYELEKKVLVFAAFKRLELQPKLHSEPCINFSDKLNFCWLITHEDFDPSTPECYSFNQLMIESGFPFKEDGVESYCLLGSEVLEDNTYVPLEDFTILSYALTDEEVINIYKEFNIEIPRRLPKINKILNELSKERNEDYSNLLRYIFKLEGIAPEYM